MKKKLALSLALAFTMGVAGTAFADSNPFVDVNSKHWSYNAVSKLAKDGIIDGYADKTFQGDKTLTRYEMAQAVAKAVAKADKASAEDKALIQKLYTEYKEELKGMNVRVSSLEGDVKELKDKQVVLTGQLRASYQKHEIENVNQDDGQNRFYLCLEGIVKINDNWSAHFYNETSQYYGSQAVTQKGDGVKVGTDGEGENSTWKRTWVSGKIGQVNVDFGKKWYCYGYNNAVGIQGSGFNTNFKMGNVNTDVFYFKPSWGQQDISKKINMYGAHFGFAAGKNTNVNVVLGGNTKDETQPTGYDHISSWGEIGFDTTFAQDWKFTAAYSKTNAEKENHGLYARIDYKGVDANKPGSYGIFARYYDRHANADPCGDNEDGSIAQGWKTYGVGVEYAVAKNIVWQNLYYHAVANSEGDKRTGNIFRSHLDFHF